MVDARPPPPSRVSRRQVLRAAVAGVGGGAGLAGCLSSLSGRSTMDTVTIFHAGSLAAPFAAVQAAFEETHDAVVNREVLGSVGSTQKITEQGRSADVLGVADYRLIRDMVVPEFGDWYAVFATNAMSIAYTEESTGAGEFGPDTWWEVLARGDVAWGHSDPAVDPNGYRSVMAMQLGRTPFRGDRLYGDRTYRRLRERERIPAATETDLISQLRSGELDYAWEYQSAGASHGVPVVDLQPSVDLSKLSEEYADHYATASVETDSGTFTGAPIAYGITVPSVAENPEGGAAWVEFVASGEGRRLMAEHGFEPVSPALVPASARAAVPARVMDRARARDSLGPLRL